MIGAATPVLVIAPNGKLLGIRSAFSDKVIRPAPGFARPANARESG